MNTLGSYEVHKSEYDFNPSVFKAIATAKLTKNSRDYIDCISGEKDVTNIREAKDEKRITARKEGLEDREEGR